MGQRRLHAVSGTLVVLLSVAVCPVAPAAAQSQGPNAPATVVDDPSVGLAAWISPESAALSDDVRAFVYFNCNPNCEGQTHYLRASGFGFAIPNAATIDGIQVDMERVGLITFDQQARILKGGAFGAANKALPDQWPLQGVDTVATYGGNGDLWGETWTPADINDADFGFAISVFIAENGPAFVDAISITVFYSICGDNQVGISEDCDDGNLLGGDCCSASCAFEAAGSPCPGGTACIPNECNNSGSCQAAAPINCDDDNLCTQDSCDPVNGCVNAGVPAAGCRTAQKSIFRLKDDDADVGDRLAWKWINGPVTTQVDFGVPTATTQHALCIYGGSPSDLVARYVVDADAMSWSALGAQGYKYKEPSGSAGGITKVLLKGNAENRSKCLVKGAGDGLYDFDLTSLVAPITVQLVNDTTSACFESTFNQSDLVKFNDPVRFKAKALEP
jgi:cysteine-rich repeat protein